MPKKPYKVKKVNVTQLGKEVHQLAIKGHTMTPAQFEKARKAVLEKLQRQIGTLDRRVSDKKFDRNAAITGFVASEGIGALSLKAGHLGGFGAMQAPAVISLRSAGGSHMEIRDAKKRKKRYVQWVEKVKK